MYTFSSYFPNDLFSNKMNLVFWLSFLINYRDKSDNFENSANLTFQLKVNCNNLFFKQVVVVVGGLVTESCPTLATPWTVAHQAPLSMEFSRQEYWSGLPFPSSGDLSDPQIKLRSSTL